jgi:RimJ/RimL family protein N-acetyltransferase
MLRLRPSVPADIDLFFAWQQDPQAVWMAAFTSANLSDRAAFELRWRRVLNDRDVTVRTVLAGGEPVGQVVRHLSDTGRQVSYWVDREHWGQGYATAALGLLLQELPERPLHARVAQDNVASLAVLRHNGFAVVGEDQGPAAGRGEVVKEFLLTLR